MDLSPAGLFMFLSGRRGRHSGNIPANIMRDGPLAARQSSILTLALSTGLMHRRIGSQAVHRDPKARTMY